MSDIALEMRGIDVRFANTHALKKVNFDLKCGEVHALLGENGAGKSTLIKVLGGIYHPDEGDLVIDGKSVSINTVNEARAHGIGIIHQEIMLVPYLSVAENIFLGREIAWKNRRALINKDEMFKRAEEMANDLGICVNVRALAGELPIAQQQLVEIIKAISFNVKILVMDEPTSSLSKEEADTLFEIMKNLQKKKVSIIYISHRMEELFRVSDRVTILRDGQYIGTKVTAETNVNELVSMMVGRELESFYVRTYNKPGEVALKVENLKRVGVFEDVSFEVHKGEILGFAGLVGAGRSEVAMAIFGADPYQGGQVYLNGKPVHYRSPKAAIAAGLCLVPEDRKLQGLTLKNTVGFNLTLASLNYLMKGLLISNKKKDDMVAKYIQMLSIKTPSADTTVSSLSGGNQQKVVLSKWLSTEPSVLILDEPTRGIDVHAKQEIYTIMNELVKQGISIILISSELPEIINMSDRVCVFRNGRLVKTFDRGTFDQEKIMLHATGGTIGE